MITSRKTIAEWLMAPAIGLGLLGVWEVLARTGCISAQFFPAPTTVFAALHTTAGDDHLSSDFLWTLERLATGFALAVVPAIALGLAMGRSRRLRLAIDPLIAAIHPLPKIAIYPILMLMFGMFETSKVALIALGAFFPILISTMAGVRQISPIHFEAAQNYGANWWRTFTRVLLPGSLPMILTGVRLGANLALLLTISVEMLRPDQQRRGLGGMVFWAWETLRTERIYAALFVIAAMGIVLNATLDYLRRRWVPWQYEPQEV